jgi:hypothetical protein
LISHTISCETKASDDDAIRIYNVVNDFMAKGKEVAEEAPREDPSSDEEPMPHEIQDKDDSKNTRWRSRRYFLTYKGWVNKLEYHNWFTEKFGRKFKRITPFVIAHETGDKTNPYRHTHVFVDFNDATQFYGCTWADYDGPWVEPIPFHVHPNIKSVIVRKSQPVDHILRYIAKEDPELAALKEQYKKKPQVPIAARVWAQRSMEDVLLLAQRPSDAQGLAFIWENNPSVNRNVQRCDEKVLELSLYEWQIELIDMFKRDPDDRKIYWYVDRVGGAGKSTFCRYLRALDRRDGSYSYFHMNQFGGGSNCATIIEGAVSGGWDGSVILIDLSRQFKDWEIYHSFEMIKNGVVTTTKYRGKTIEFGTPHVVVFANFPPNPTRMSADRWVIRNIGPPYRESVLNAPGNASSSGCLSRGPGSKLEEGEGMDGQVHRKEVPRSGDGNACKPTFDGLDKLAKRLNGEETSSDEEEDSEDY